MNVAVAKTVPLLQINPEFRRELPPLSKEEFDGLESSLLSVGCLDSIKTWKGYIVDGHNRHAICRKYNLGFKTEEVSFPNERSARKWIIEHQVSRRNLSIEVRLSLSLELLEIDKQEAQERQEKSQIQNRSTAGSTLTAPQKVFEKGKALEKVAERAGCSYGTAYKYKKVKEAGLEEELAKGASINKVSNIVDLATEAEKIALKQGTTTVDHILAEQKKKTFRPTNFPDGKYSVIYSNFYEETHLGQVPTKSFSDIKNLPVKTLLEDYAAAFLVAPPRYLQETLDVMRYWGFRYENMLVMTSKAYDCKYVSGQHNLLLIGTKGEFLPEKLPPFLLGGSNTHRLLDDLYPGKSKLEMFGDKKKEGWDIYD